MPRSGTTPVSRRQRLFPYVFFAMVITVYLLLTIAAVMLVTGSLHVMNRNFFHFDDFGMITMAAAAIIAITAAMFLAKNARKAYRYITDITAGRTDHGKRIPGKPD